MTKEIYAAVFMTGQYEDCYKETIFVCEDKSFVEQFISNTNKLLKSKRLDYRYCEFGFGEKYLAFSDLSLGGLQNPFIYKLEKNYPPEHSFLIYSGGAKILLKTFALVDAW